MSTNYDRQRQQKLHSPLLKGKRTYFNPSLENKPSDNNIDETLDKTLFNHKELPITLRENNTVNFGLINLLETLIKIAGVLILASGGIFSLLEFTNIARSLYLGNYDIRTSLITFVAAFIGTVVSSIICISFSHLIKTTKQLYLHSENQSRKIEKLLTCLIKN